MTETTPTYDGNPVRPVHPDPERLRKLLHELMRHAGALTKTANQIVSEIECSHPEHRTSRDRNIMV